MNSDKAAYRLVGRVLRPHGVRGQFIVYLESDFPKWLAKRKQFFIETKHGMSPWPVEKARYDGKKLFLKVATLPDRTAVEAHRDQELFITEEEAVEVTADPDYFYNSDLVGCEVFDLNGQRSLGTVTSVLEMPAQNLLEVKRAKGQPLLIPFVDAFLGEIRQDLIEVKLPPGFEECFEDEAKKPKSRSE